jgi:hypothetical protein
MAKKNSHLLEIGANDTATAKLASTKRNERMIELTIAASRLGVLDIR